MCNVEGSSMVPSVTCVHVTHPLRWQSWMLVWLTSYCLLMARSCWRRKSKSVGRVQHCVQYSSLTCLCYLSYAWCTTHVVPLFFQACSLMSHLAYSLVSHLACSLVSHLASCLVS